MLLDALLRLNFPLHLALLGLEAARAPRIIRYGGAVSGGTFPCNSILAGCGQATSVAKALLWQLLFESNAWHGKFQVLQFVDDLQAKAWAPSPHAAGQLASNGVGDLLRGLKGLRLYISPKTVLLASSAAAGRHLQQGLAKQGLHFTLEQGARCLGADTAFGKRRSAKVQKSRITMGARRAPRTSKLAAQTEQAVKLIRPGVTAQATWGGEVMGLPPSRLQRLRGLMLHAAGKLGKAL